VDAQIKKMFSNLKSKDMGVRLRALKSLIDVQSDHPQLLECYKDILLRKADIKSEFEEQFFYLVCSALKSLGNIDFGGAEHTEDIVVESIKTKKKAGILKRFAKQREEECPPSMKLLLIETLSAIGGNKSVTTLKELVRTEVDQVVTEAARNGLEHIDRRLHQAHTRIDSAEEKDIAPERQTDNFGGRNVMQSSAGSSKTQSQDGDVIDLTNAEALHLGPQPLDDDAVNFNLSDYLIEEVPAGPAETHAVIDYDESLLEDELKPLVELEEPIDLQESPAPSPARNGPGISFREKDIVIPDDPEIDGDLSFDLSPRSESAGTKENMSSVDEEFDRVFAPHTDRKAESPRTDALTAESNVQDDELADIIPEEMGNDLEDSEKESDYMEIEVEIEDEEQTVEQQPTGIDFADKMEENLELIGVDGDIGDLVEINEADPQPFPETSVELTNNTLESDNADFALEDDTGLDIVFDLEEKAGDPAEEKSGMPVTEAKEQPPVAQEEDELISGDQVIEELMEEFDRDDRDLHSELKPKPRKNLEAGPVAQKKGKTPVDSKDQLKRVMEQLSSEIGSRKSLKKSKKKMELDPLKKSIKQSPIKLSETNLAHPEKEMIAEGHLGPESTSDTPDIRVAEEETVAIPAENRWRKQSEKEVVLEEENVAEEVDFEILSENEPAVAFGEGAESFQIGGEETEIKEDHDSQDRLHTNFADADPVKLDEDIDLDEDLNAGKDQSSSLEFHSTGSDGEDLDEMFLQENGPSISQQDPKVEARTGTVAESASSEEVEIALDKVPALSSTVGNIMGLNLSIDEGYILSLIDGHTSVINIARISGIPKNKAIQLLGDLLRKGIIVFN